MALLFIDGFDHYGTGGATNPATTGKWVVGLDTVNGSTTVVRTGTNSGVFGTSASTIITKQLPASGGAIVGGAWHATSAFPSAVPSDIIQVREGTTVHMTVGITAGGLLTVKRGTTVLATGTTVLSLNSWYYIELKTIIHDVNGSYEVRINGVTEAALTNAGPVDTQNTGTGQWDRIQIASLGSGTNANYIDDFYVCDTSGAAPRNTFLGTVKVETLLPQAGNGTNTELTPSTGTDHGALVDEATPNTTDYNSSATVGQKDTYNYPPMTLTGTIYGIQTNLYVQKSDAAARSVCAVVRHGGVDTDGVNVNPLTTFNYFSEMWQQKPDASEWTTADIAAIEVGMKVTA